MFTMYVMCTYLHITCCLDLLSAKASPNAGNIQGNTPVHLAVMCKQMECLKVLLHHADLEIKNVSGRTPFDVRVAGSNGADSGRKPWH